MAVCARRRYLEPKIPLAHGIGSDVCDYWNHDVDYRVERITINCESHSASDPDSELEPKPVDLFAMWSSSEVSVGGNMSLRNLQKIAVSAMFFVGFLAAFPVVAQEKQTEIEQAREALKANAYSPEAHYRLAHLYFDARKYDEAIVSYQRAIELKPSYREAYLALATVYLRQNNRDEEMEVYRRAISALPKDLDLLESAAEAMSETGRYAEAIDTQQRVVQGRSDDKASH